MLDDHAISGCSSLKEVYFDTDAIFIGTDNFTGCFDVKVYGPADAPVLSAYCAANNIPYNEYPVFFYDDEVMIAAGYARAGGLLGNMTPPSKKLFTFDGWINQDTGATWHVDMDRMPFAPLSLIASWRFDFQTESVRGGIKLVRYTGNEKTLNIPDEVNGKKVVSIEDRCFDGINITLMGDQDDVAYQYAQEHSDVTFKALTYTIVFDSQGGSYIEPMQIAYGEKMTLPVPQKKDGWFYAWYLPEEQIYLNSSSTMPKRDIIVYATWRDTNNTNPEALFTTTLQDDQLTLTGYLGTTAGDIVIPSTINGQPVVAIAEGAFRNETKLRTVTIPGSIKTISARAFEGSYITSVILESGCTVIGEQAFRNCPYLSSVTLPEGITSIQSRAFENCAELTRLALPLSIKEIAVDAFDGCAALTAFSMSGTGSYYKVNNGVLLSRDGTKLILYPLGKSNTSYTLPSTVTAIGDRAFAGCKLSTVNFDAKLKTIGAEAFRSCRNLSVVNFQSSAVLAIGDSAFTGCVKLQSISLPSSVASIGKFAFSVCPLSSITIPGDASIGAGAIPSDATIYGSRGTTPEAWALAQGIHFVDQENDVLVTGIRLNTVTKTGDVGSSFTLTATLTPSTATDTTVQWVSSDPTVAVIESASGMKATVALHSPGSCTITARASNGSTTECAVTVNVKQVAVTSVILPQTITLTVGAEIPLRAGIQPANADDPTLAWTSSNGAVAAYSNGVLVAKKAGTATLTATSTNGKSGTVSVKVIAAPKFTFQLPGGLKNLEAEAFMGLPAKAICCNDGLTKIGARAFGDCTGLTSILIPASVQKIDSTAFNGCSSSLVIYCAYGSIAEAFAEKYGYGVAYVQ